MSYVSPFTSYDSAIRTNESPFNLLYFAIITGLPVITLDGIITFQDSVIFHDSTISTSDSLTYLQDSLTLTKYSVIITNDYLITSSAIFIP